MTTKESKIFGGVGIGFYTKVIGHNGKTYKNVPLLVLSGRTRMEGKEGEEEEVKWTEMWKILTTSRTNARKKERMSEKMQARSNEEASELLHK